MTYHIDIPPDIFDIKRTVPIEENKSRTYKQQVKWIGH